MGGGAFKAHPYENQTCLGAVLSWMLVGEKIIIGNFVY